LVKWLLNRYGVYGVIPSLKSTNHMLATGLFGTNLAIDLA